MTSSLNKPTLFDLLHTLVVVVTLAVRPDSRPLVTSVRQSSLDSFKRQDLKWWPQQISMGRCSCIELRPKSNVLHLDVFMGVFLQRYDNQDTLDRPSLPHVLGTSQDSPEELDEVCGD